MFIGVRYPVLIRDTILLQHLSRLSSIVLLLRGRLFVRCAKYFIIICVLLLLVIVLKSLDSLLTIGIRRGIMTSRARCTRGIILGATGITNHARASCPRMLKEDRGATLTFFILLLLWVMPDSFKVINRGGGGSDLQVLSYSHLFLVLQINYSFGDYFLAREKFMRE